MYKKYSRSLPNLQHNFEEWSISQAFCQPHGQQDQKTKGNKKPDEKQEETIWMIYRLL